MSQVDSSTPSLGRAAGEQVWWGDCVEEKRTGDAPRFMSLIFSPLNSPPSPPALAWSLQGQRWPQANVKALNHPSAVAREFPPQQVPKGGAQLTCRKPRLMGMGQGPKEAANSPQNFF